LASECTKTTHPLPAHQGSESEILKLCSDPIINAKFTMYCFLLQKKMIIQNQHIQISTRNNF